MPGAIGNFFMKAIISSPLHPLLGANFAVVTVEGRKTGRLYSTPVNAVKDGDIFTVVSLRSRSWWRNLRGGRPARLRASGKQYSVRGEVLESHGEVVDGLAHFLQRHPGYAKYYGVRLASDGRPMQDDLERVADERVLIRLSSAVPQ
ncbi:MAG TPA: nitroreductase/quinone reductase family protein [Anaerolineae bacterium]|nr:nitroreductase/quinone reductase family protein [Anaerolineae bacterium]